MKYRSRKRSILLPLRDKNKEIMKKKLTAKFNESKEFKVSNTIHHFLFSFRLARIPINYAKLTDESKQKIYNLICDELIEHFAGINYVVEPPLNYNDGMIIMNGIAKIQIHTPAVISNKRLQKLQQPFWITYEREVIAIRVEVEYSQDDLGSWEDLIKEHNNPSSEAYGKVLRRVPGKINFTIRKHAPGVIKTTIIAGTIVAFDIAKDGVIAAFKMLLKK